MTDDPRRLALETLVRAAGVHAVVSVAGVDDDLAVVHGVTPDQVSHLAPRVKDLGFRRLTVDLASMPGAGD